MPLLPVALYGLEVPAGDIITPAVPDFPATFRITMAAIDPSAEPETGNTKGPARATLKLLRQPIEVDEDDEDEDDEYMKAILAGSDSEEDSEEESENGGPSDPAKSKKARKAAALAELMATLRGEEEDSDEEMEDAAPKSKKAPAKKGKGKAAVEVVEEEESEEDDEDDEDEDDFEIEEFVICTLDSEKNYQQTLDITIAEDERVFFKVSGTHTIYLTGNYVIPDDNGHNHHHEVYDSEDDEDDEDYDLSPDEDELELLDEDEEDDLDDLEGPRVEEVESDNEVAPKLVETKATKADKKSKKRAAEEDLQESLDEQIAKEEKLSKKQQKKLKTNQGAAAAAPKEDEKKKVQFAKNLEQGPSGSEAKAKLGVKTVNGVQIDDKKIGSGRAAKKGDRVSMRYIGKLTDGKVFDANKKGKPFSFKLGTGEVIQGWDIGIAGMTVGGERRISIPAHLAYGSKALPGIPANSPLIFDVKLLEIK